MPPKSWWARLPFGVRMTAGAGALLVLVGGGTAGAAALFTGDKPPVVTAVQQPAAAPGQPESVPPAREQLSAEVTGNRRSEVADRTRTREPRVATSTPPATQPATAPAVKEAVRVPVVTIRTVTEQRELAFDTRLIRDPDMPRGTRRVAVEGIPGEQTLTYRVTYSDGRLTERRLIGTEVTRQPQHRVIAFGTRSDEDGDGDGGDDGDGEQDPRECKKDRCVPQGRSAGCPDEDRTESTNTVLDEDLHRLDPSELAGLELDPALLC